MNALIVIAISIVLLFFGIFKGLHFEYRFKNLSARRFAIVLFWTGCVHLILSVVIITGPRVFAESWIKEEMLVKRNPGDGDYYLDLGDRYYKLKSFYDSDFKALRNDTCIVYRPGPAKIFGGYITSLGEKRVSEWEIRRADDIIYERLIKQNPIAVELK
jgi:hypothetical protein